MDILTWSPDYDPIIIPFFFGCFPGNSHTISNAWQSFRYVSEWGHNEQLFYVLYDDATEYLIPRTKTGCMQIIVNFFCPLKPVSFAVMVLQGWEGVICGRDGEKEFTKK